MSKRILKRTLSISLVLVLLCLFPLSASAATAHVGALLKTGSEGSLVSYVRVLPTPLETTVALITIERQVNGVWTRYTSWSEVASGNLISLRDFWAPRGYMYRILVNGATASLPYFAVESNHYWY